MMIVLDVFFMLDHEKCEKLKNYTYFKVFTATFSNTSVARCLLYSSFTNLTKK